MSDFGPMWGGRRLMAKTILYFHFDHLKPSLTTPLWRTHLGTCICVVSVKGYTPNCHRHKMHVWIETQKILLKLLGL